MNGSFCLPFSKILLYGRDRMTNALCILSCTGCGFPKALPISRIFFDIAVDANL